MVVDFVDEFLVVPLAAVLATVGREIRTGSSRDVDAAGAAADR